MHPPCHPSIHPTTPSPFPVYVTCVAFVFIVAFWGDSEFFPRNAGYPTTPAVSGRKSDFSAYFCTQTVGSIIIPPPSLHTPHLLCFSKRFSCLLWLPRCDLMCLCTECLPHAASIAPSLSGRLPCRLANGLCDRPGVANLNSLVITVSRSKWSDHTIATGMDLFGWQLSCQNNESRSWLLVNCFLSTLSPPFVTLFASMAVPNKLPRGRGRAEDCLLMQHQVYSIHLVPLQWFHLLPR